MTRSAEKMKVQIDKEMHKYINKITDLPIHRVKSQTIDNHQSKAGPLKFTLDDLVKSGWRIFSGKGIP